MLVVNESRRSTKVSIKTTLRDVFSKMAIRRSSSSYARATEGRDWPTRMEAIRADPPNRARRLLLLPDSLLLLPLLGISLCLEIRESSTCDEGRLLVRHWESWRHSYMSSCDRAILRNEALPRVKAAPRRMLVMITIIIQADDKGCIVILGFGDEDRQVCNDIAIERSMPTQFSGSSRCHLQIAAGAHSLIHSLSQAATFRCAWTIHSSRLECHADSVSAAR
jgi:hypothetical protein